MNSGRRIRDLNAEEIGTPRLFWARGYFVSSVGRDEAAIREYIQEQEDQRLDQLNLWR